MTNVLFIDFDGTLHDSDAKYRSGLEGALGLSGREVWQAYIHVHRNIVHLSVPERHDDIYYHQRLMFSHLGREYDDKLARELTRRFEEARSECWTDPNFFPDALPFLNRAKDLGYTLYLTTGDFGPEKAEAVHRAGARCFFEHAFDSRDLGPKGTTTSYYAAALAAVGRQPREVMVVGDSLIHDMAPAARLGMTTLWVNRTGSKLPDCNPRPRYEARDLLKAMDYLTPAPRQAFRG